MYVFRWLRICADPGSVVTMAGVSSSDAQAPRGTCADWDLAFAIVVARKVNGLSWVNPLRNTRSS